MWMIYIAVATDLFSDGLMIVTGSAVSLQLAVLLALAQVTADVPEGYASIANMRENGLPRRTRLVLAGSFAILILLTASLAYWLLRDQPAVLQMSALAFTAGLLVIVAVEDMVPEAHESVEDFPLATGAFIGGFALFTLTASYLE
jgi:ZIP family zinc transporter